MKRIMIIGAVGILLGVGLAPAARAQWYAHASQPDVFGNRTVDAFVVAGSSGDALVVQCDQKDALDLAYIFPATPKELDSIGEMSEIPVKLFLKVDNGAVITLAATMRGWNSTRGGFVVSGRLYATVKAIQEIGTARTVIGVGVDVAGNKQSDNFGATGSTTAMQTVIKDCKLADIKPSDASSN